MDVSHVAKLANLTVTPQEEAKFSSQFSDTLSTIDLINTLDTSSTSPTFQVTGLKNITRMDVIDTDSVIPQTAVLSQAHKVHNGFIVVPRVFDE